MLFFEQIIYFYGFCVIDWKSIGLGGVGEIRIKKLDWAEENYSSKRVNAHEGIYLLKVKEVFLWNN